jgi:hypothetical protein
MPKKFFCYNYETPAQNSRRGSVNAEIGSITILVYYYAVRVTRIMANGR